MRNVCMSICVCVIMLTASNASALLVQDFQATDTPSLGNILNDPALDQVTDTGDSLIRIPDKSRYVNFTLMLEDAGFAKTNTFGIYNIDNPNIKLQVFSGKDHKDKNVKVNFDTNKNKAWIKRGKKVDMGTNFGFYIDSSKEKEHGGGVFYSDSSLNINEDFGIDHVLLFGTSNSSRYTDIVIAFEDLRVNSPTYDRDYNDMVVGVSGCDINIVPEPATIAMLSTGMLLLIRKNQ